MIHSVRRNLYFLFGLAVFGLFLINGCEQQIVVQSSDICERESEAEQIIVQSLLDEDAVIRSRAVETIARQKLVHLMPKVARLLRDDFVPVRFAAAVAAGDMRYKFAEPTLQKLYELAEDEDTKLAAAFALGRLGDEQKYGTLLAVLNKRIPKNQGQASIANAAWLLGKTGKKEYLKNLYRVMRSPESSDKVVFAAAEAIARLGDEEIMDKLWTMIISAYSDVRVMGVYSMGALGTRQAKNVIMTTLDDDIPEVRLVAAEQLGKLGEIEQSSVVRDFLDNPPRDRTSQELQRARMLAALAIGSIQTKELEAYLPILLKDESLNVRLAAAGAVMASCR